MCICYLLFYFTCTSHVSHIVSSYITSYYIISYYITSYYIILHYVVLFHIISYYIMSYYFILYYVRPAGRGQATEGLALQFEHMSSSLEKVSEWLLWQYSLQLMMAITLGVVYFKSEIVLKWQSKKQIIIERKEIKKKYQKRWNEISFIIIIIIIIIIKNFNLSESIDVHTIYCKRWSW